MRRISATLFAALIATNLAQAAELPAMPLTPLAQPWSLMGNGGPNQLPGSCEVGVDHLKSAERQLNSVHCANTEMPSFGGASRSINTSQFRGKRVRISAELMASGIEDVTTPQYGRTTGEAGLWITAGSPATGVRTDRTEGRGIKGTTGWVQLDFVLDLPADNRMAILGFWMQGKGQVWLRDILVEEVSGTMPVNTFVKSSAEPDFSLTGRSTSRPDDFFQPPPAKWVAQGAPGFELCNIGVETRLLKEGQRNLSISCTVATNSMLRQAFLATPWWGKRVRFSGWIKTENVQGPPETGERGGAGLFLGTTGPQGTVVNTSLSGTTAWQYSELVMDIPRNSEWIPVGLSLSGSGQVWARDFRFEEVSRDTPVTPIALPAAFRQIQPPVQPQTASALTPSTVRIMPAESGMDAQRRSSWEQYASSLAATLRGLPGLTLITPDSAGATRADYELSLRPPTGDGNRGIAIEVKSQRTASASSGRSFGYFTGAVTFFSKADGGNVQEDVDRFLMFMRTSIFPPDPAFQKMLLARMADAGLDYSERIQAFSDLLNGSRPDLHPVHGPSRADPAFILAAVEFANSQSDPDKRSGIWGRLRETGSPLLVAPMIQALGTEKHANVRLTLVGILARSFGTSPEVRTALASIARSEPRQLTRMAAQRALTGNADWNGYLQSTLKNAQLTAEQRLEPLAYLDTSGLYQRLQERPSLDDESLRMVGALIASPEKSPVGAGNAAFWLSESSSAVAREVIFDLLRPGEGKSLLPRELRNYLLSLQGRNVSSDSGVRAAVEHVAARDPDPELRELAGALLRSPRR